MKRSYLIVTFLCALSVSVGAQQNVRKLVLGASAGISLPYNEFAYNTFRYDAGFAATGLNFMGEYLFYGNFIGFTSSIGYTNIFFDERAWLAEYDRTLSGYGINEVSAGNYQIVNFLVGLTLKIPEMKHTEVMFLFHIGLALCVHPDLLATNSEFGVISSVERDTDTSPIANAGIKVNYWLNDRYGLTMNGSLNATRPGFMDSSGVGGSFFVPMEYANINLGFVMILNAPSP